MQHFRAIAMIMAGAAFAVPALAQDAAAPAAPAAAPAAATPSAATPAAPAAGSSSFAPDQVTKFAKALTKVNAINTDATIPADQKQTQMVAAIEQEGLDPNTFNQIAQAYQSDASLRDQVTSINAQQ